MVKTKAFSAIILAGGNSSRMKTNKALLMLKGQTIIQTIINQLVSHFQEILIISNTPELYHPFNVPVYPDIFLKQGPLAGIHSGLKHMSTPCGFFVACDMPFFSPQLAQELLSGLEEYQAMVPKKNKYLQPLHAAYRKDCLPYVEKVLQKQERPKIISFYELININYLDFNQRADNEWDQIFFNVNTPEDYELAKHLRSEKDSATVVAKNGAVAR
ncbi:molybdenum cofactor guanylyltransferase [Desulforamulus aeronauticus]|uniref:Probable molybdenum cofactor guanylyltransferase n=1 Tax=Desulforamulus aeronauticus DSM 10349 TaxID=1121421 RepID=A0A1M6PBZ6_9FIRM|nr:molybdenum cofactor guanylyltransferase [Desulforamulus aeronauticus]SHK05489.1 molybdenum cofactor guanylyltransferase [Desulforamulus aeronauticus DSM 10349]